VAAPALEVARLCRNKNTTYAFFAATDFVPRAIAAPADGIYPIFAKPAVGQGSQGAERVVDSARHAQLLESGIEYVFSEYLPGIECTVDCISDQEGVLLHLSPRVRERIKSVDIVQADGSALTAGTLTINVPNAPAAGAAQSNDGGQLRALSGVSDWQLYCYRGNAWSNCQSSADAGQPIPDGMRLVLAFAEGSGFSGTVTRDVAIAP